MVTVTVMVTVIATVPVIITVTVIVVVPVPGMRSGRPRIVIIPGVRCGQW